MADVASIEECLSDLESYPGVNEAVLISRSGMHIAGSVPDGAHAETYVAMFAILLGAAETAISELKDKLDAVLINLSESKVMVVNNGPKALYVLRLTPEIDFHGLRTKLLETSKTIEQYL
ncbi:MAG: roadblock/LC7 domain-containing protein [Thermoplasmata archaeon]|nr:roadblock/LC7 domain-containing protein [Thermoplasmata archaeon]